jgi:adhesin/invasin
LPSSDVTNAAGVATFAYTASTMVGFCTVTATDLNSGLVGSTTVDQTGTATNYNLTLRALPTTIVGDGTSTSYISATVTGSASAPIVGDMVEYSLGAGCGLIGAYPAGPYTTGPFFVATQGSGGSGGAGLANASYKALTNDTSSNIVCTITAQEANQALVRTTTITQTPKNYSIVLTAVPINLFASGSTTSLITATVDNQSGAAQSGVTVNFTEAGGGAPGPACGTPATISGTTNALGQVTYTYTSSTTSGFCAITGTETHTGQIGTVTLDQTNPASIGIDHIGVTAVAPTIVGDGSSHSTITATVTDAASAPIANDMVEFTLGGGCGTLSGGAPYFEATNSSGQAILTYTSADTAPATTNVICTVTAQEAYTAQANSATVTQTPLYYSNVLTASPMVLTANGLSSSTITATVTNAEGLAQQGVTVNFSDVGGGNPSGACGTPATITVHTNAAGHASYAYTSSTTAGFCTITGTEEDTGAVGHVTLDQTIA